MTDCLSGTPSDSSRGARVETVDWTRLPGSTANRVSGVTMQGTLFFNIDLYIFDKIKLEMLMHFYITRRSSPRLRESRAIDSFKRGK